LGGGQLIKLGEVRLVSRDRLTIKTKPRFGECYTCFGYETKTGVVRILVIFEDRPMFSRINEKLSPRHFN